MKIVYKEERLTPEAYIDFLKRTNLGSQYPKERFLERIAKLVKNVSISCLVAGAAFHGLRISEDPVKFKVGNIAGILMIISAISFAIAGIIVAVKDKK